jgi:hypothetical protein
MFNKYTNQIIDFLENCEFDQKLLNSNYDNSFLNNLISDYSKSEFNIIKKDPQKIINPNKNLDGLLYNNDFSSTDIIENAHSSKILLEEWENHNTHICIYTPSPKKPNIKLIYLFINIIRKVFNNDQHLLLVIFYSDKQKFLPLKKKKITSQNMNSGSCLKKNFIYIWRKEEFYKVLLHELIHYFELDFAEYDGIVLKNKIDSLFKISGVNVINEAFTEILALTFFSTILSEGIEVSFDKIIQYENLFTHCQIAKIIIHFGGKTYDDLFNITINQSTSVTSYIIIKGILLNNYSLMLSFFKNYLFKNYKKSIKFDEYKKIFLNLMNKNSLNKNIINCFIKSLLKEKNEFILNTLRMTVFA